MTRGKSRWKKIEGGKMSDEEREKLMEKRSSLRSWRERGGKMPRNVELIGAGLIAIIFLALIASSFLGVPQANNTTEQPKKTPVPTPAPVSARSPVSLSPVSLPAPSIKINSPENITYNTSTPPLDFIVAGSNLDSVLLSVDGGGNITVPHGDSMAKIDFAKGNPIFIDDFSEGAKRWTGDFNVIDGEYILSNGDSVVGDGNWTDYAVEAKVNIKNGKNVAYLGLRWSNGTFYGIHTTPDPSELRMIKAPPYTILSSIPFKNLDTNEWHTWGIKAEGRNIKAYIDGSKYLEYTDNGNPNLQGKVRIMAEDTLVHFDDVVVYLPLSNGLHNLTIFARNSAGNSSFRTVYFTINASLAEAEKNSVGKIGVPVVKDGFEVTVKSVIPSTQYTSAWLSIKNLGGTEKTPKLGPGNIIVDNMGQQYESIKVPRSAEIAQTDLYPLAMREGGVYFEKLKDNSRSVKKLVLYIDDEKLEFNLDLHN